MVKAAWHAPATWCNPRGALGFVPMRSLTSIPWCHAAAPVAATLATLALGGCGAPEELPAPGADDLVVVHWWDEKKAGPPAYLQAEKVAQGDAEFGKLEFSTVMMRLPGADGVVYVSAPRALYDRGAQEEIILGTDPTRPIDGPVRFMGVWNGDLFMGRAAKGVFEEASHRMRLEQVEIASNGLRQRTAWAAITQSQSVPFGELVRLPDAPALTAALAALPSPLVLPPMRQ
jgi:hypothetical protein